MKYFLISAVLHSLLLLVLTGGFWFGASSPDRSGGPMQVLILPEQIEIVEKPQPLRQPKLRKSKKLSKKYKIQPALPLREDKGERSSKSVATSSASESQGLDEKTEKLRLSYSQALYMYIANNRYYPRKAMKLNQSGTVSVRFHVTADGEFKHVHLEKGCNHETLNKAAVTLIEKLGRFKPLPDAVARSREFVVPIEYRMARGR